MAEQRPRARRGRRVLLVVGVLAFHVWLLENVAQHRVGWGSGDKPPARIEVAFVRMLAAAAPPTPPPPPEPARPAARLPAVKKVAKAGVAASAPASAASAAADTAAAAASEAAAATALAAATEPPAAVAPEPPTEPASAAASVGLAAASAPDPSPSQPAVVAASAASAPAAASASAATVAANAASAPRFNWPPSTRLSFKLVGNYRGTFEGSARVDWLRAGPRYQVHLETSVGPLLSRHITSEGELGPQGLVPRRFVGEQRVLMSSTRRWSLSFGPDRVVLADGSTAEAMPGMQDEASQFVQLTWLFINRPDLLKVGRAVEMPLAISRKLERWTYAVVAEETLRLGFGAVPTFHLKPRREAGGGDKSAEIWIAPTLQYLPVRILIRQNQDNWVDLMLESPPLQAADEPVGGTGAEPPPVNR